MKKAFPAILIVLALALCACGKGVSREEYDAVCAERDELKAQNETLIGQIRALGDLADAYTILQGSVESQKEIAACRANVEKDYSAVTRLFDAVQSGSEEMAELRADFDTLHDSMVRTINNTEAAILGYQSEITAADPGADPINVLRASYSSWSATVTRIQEMFGAVRLPQE